MVVRQASNFASMPFMASDHTGKNNRLEVLGCGMMCHSTFHKFIPPGNVILTLLVKANNTTAVEPGTCGMEEIEQ